MKVFTLLIFFIFLVSGSTAERLYNQVPHLLVQDGNLIFIAASDKDIKFRTTSSAGVSINDIDLLTTLNKAHNATKLLENYQKNFALYTDRIDSLEQRVTDTPIRWGNSSDPGTFFFRRLNRRFNVLQKKVLDMQTTLLLDDCVDNPCKNGGTCMDLFKGYLCHCIEGWQGTNCAEDVNECSIFAGTDLGCQNGATCINKPGTYECLCQPGYVGMHCTRRKADCGTGGQELCGHGTCVQQNNQIGYKCICDQGWTTDVKNQACIVDVDECNLNHPACSRAPSVPCINVPGSFYCGACPRGYTGNGYYCADINECEFNNGGCSVNPMVTCVNTQGSRLCGPCPPGYEGEGITCSFRGLCNVHNGGCHYLAQCTDNPRIGSTYVECICPSGYTGNGIGPNGCIPFNACASNPCVNGDCHISNRTGYTCSCKGRYTGRNCDILKDPCSSNPCLNGGTCQNLIGINFKCICTGGFSGLLCETEGRACGGKLFGLTGVLKYPPGDYATYGHRLSCAWTIETNATKVINITFDKFDIEMSIGCRADWLQIHDGKNSAARPLGRFCGTDLPLGGKILSTHNIIYMWFRSDGGTAKTGFQLSWNSTDPVCGGIIDVSSHGSIESPGSPGNYPPNRDCYWTLFAPFDKRLQFHFYSLNIGNNANCGQDFIEFTTKRNDVTFAKFCNSTIPSPFYSPSEDVIVYFHSDSKNSYPGFQLTYSIAEGIPGCGGIYTSEKGTIQSIKPDNLESFICEYKIQNGYNRRIRLQFLNLDLLQSPGCTEDNIEIREGPNSNSPLVGRYCGTSLPGFYVSNGPITIISSISANSNGWKIQYTQVCGMKFFNETGSFGSGSADSQPSCIYQIERPLGYVIELTLKVTVSSLHVPSSIMNYLEVRDGDHENATLIKKFCETTATEIITSTHNHLWIQYYGRMNVNTLTYEATYTSTDIGCGGILRKKMGNIASPTQAEGDYPPSSKCTWVIIAPTQFIIQLTWVTFNLEQSSDCVYDSVQVFDNNTNLGMGGLIGKYCGYTKPPILLSSGNIMTIVFTTDITNNLDGFLATYHFVAESNVCGGNYYTPAGVIKSPDYPNDYPANRICTWIISVPLGQQIMLNVTDFNLEYQTDCRYDWLEIRNGGTSTSPLIGKYCGSVIPRRIPSHTNQLFLYFKSDLSRSNRGFIISWSSTATGCGGTLTSPTGSIISPQYPEPIGRNTECTWKIIVGAGSRIQVVFSDLDLEQLVCHPEHIAVYVQLFDGLTMNSRSLGLFCNKVDKPIVSSSHQMLVKFRSETGIEGRGFQLHYSSICNNSLTGFRGVIESPNFPNSYPSDLNCWWDITVSSRNKINITFSHFELESYYKPNKSCLDDYVEIKYLEIKHDEEDYDESEPTFIRQGKYCGTDNPGQMTIDSDHAQIHLVSSKLSVGTGFRLEWQIFGCGGRLTHSSGTIQSPNYPKPYPPLIKCEWQIEVDFGYSIEIQFHEIDIEKDACVYDWIQIYNGPDNTSNIIAKICHQVKPIVISSTGNQMFIDFQSDYSYQGRGFIANYSTIPTKCGGKFTSHEGTLFSPNYPKNFDKNDSCYWLIEVDENHSIELDFDDVDLPENCDKNYIKVYDGPTEAYPVLQKVCGSAPNNTIKSTFNEMYIEFRTSNSLYTTKGFKAIYKKSCGSRITTQGSGSIQINHDEFTEYPGCAWSIVSTDPSLHITLTITRMQMHTFYCDGEKPIKIFNGETAESPLLKSFCGDKIPPPMVSDGSALTIQLYGRMDFFATYSVLDSHCGGTFNSAKGYFASPGYPNKYPSDMQCEWTINVAVGNHITISFIKFDLLESEKCNTDFLEIRKYNVSGPLLGIYCGNNKPVNLTHEGTIWMLYKGSKLDSGATVTAAGFYGEYELNDYNELSGPHGVIASPMYPLNYYNYGSFSWKIMVAPRKRILLTFKEFYVESDSSDDNCYFAKFEVYDGVDSTAPQLKSTCGMNIPDPIKSSTNIVYITIEYSSVRMGTKFLLEWLEISNVFQPVSTRAPSTEKGCGSSEVIDMSTIESSYTITSPGYPTGYKPNLNCEWIFSTIPMNHLVVYFLDINLNNFQIVPRFRIAPCTNDYVLLYQKQSEENDWELVKKVCTRADHNDLNLYFTNLLKVQFVTNSYMNGTGFKAKVLQNCGGSMSGPTGYIYFNNNTIYGSDCQWNVTVRSGKTIRVTFEEMNIAYDSSRGCNNYLMVRNGKYPDSPILGNGKYCGRDLPEPLNTTGNYLYVKYNGSPSIKGFKLRYQEISTECGGEIILSSQDNSTRINSPNYPNIPIPHTECSWLIRAPPGETLRIDFEERFDLTYQKECEIEYIELRDGGTQFSPLIGRYCGKAPNTQFSTDSIMFIKFFTNAQEPKNGFKAKISLAYCGGTIRGVKGEITNPSWQSKEPNRNCTWHIAGPLDHYLNIQITELNMHTPHQSVNKNKITIQEINILAGRITTLGEYSGTVLPPLLITSSNEAIVNYVGTSEDRFQLKFNASQTECGGIVKAESGVILSPGYPMMNHLNRNCKWIIEVPEGRRVTLDFDDFDLDETTFHDQGLAIYDGYIPFRIRIAHLRPGAPKQSYETSSNKMMIFFWSTSPSFHRGFKATFSSNKPTICSNDFTSESGLLTQPMVRNSSYWCHWKHTSRNAFFNQTFALTINLNANSTRRTNSFTCRFSAWAITVTNNDERKILANLCTPTVKNYIVRSPFATTIVDAMAKTQMNFTVLYNTYKCGGIIRDQQGYISSPNYPNKPSEWLECAWLINVDKEQTINLTMLSMDLGSDCEKSFVAVYNGDLPSRPRIGKYCKTDKPEIIISQSNSLWIEYRFETESTGTGFKLKYEAISGGCGGIYHDRSRVIQSPNYSNDYPNNAECLWEIRSNPGYSIRLKFIGRFHIEDSDKCANDYLEIWDWQHDKWKSNGKICGRDIPADIQSTGDKLKILFRSNNKTSGSGFKAIWEWRCGGTFEATKTPRSIVSPGYPLLYAPSLLCVYNITTTADVLNVNFDDFDLENGATDCLYDNVTITGKYISTHTLMRRVYCGKTKPQPFRMKGNIAITFKTDKWVNSKGFKFTYSDESCGGNINETTIIEAPSLNYQRGQFQYFYPRINCVWKITAPPHQVVILKVLHLASPSICSAQFGIIQIFNGLNEKSEKKLASLCGNLSYSDPVYADSGSMLVKLDSSPLNYGGFRAQVYFSHGPTEGCGGNINLTETKYITAPDLEDLDCRWRILAPRDHQIQILFTELNIPGTCTKNTFSEYFCTCSYIEVHDGGGLLSELIEKLCSTSNGSPEYRKFTTSWNTGFIRFVLTGRQNNTFKATLTPIPSKCGSSILNATKEIKTLTSPEYPNTYPPGIKCSWLITTQNRLDRIELHFVDFNLTGSKNSFAMYNRCDDDRLEITDDPNKQLTLGSQTIYNSQRRIVSLTFSHPVQQTFCGADDSPFDYYSTGKSVTLTFRSLITSNTGKGFKLEYRIAGCNRNYTSLQGRLFNFNDKSDCIITITVPKNRTISLYFQRLFIHYSYNCSSAGFEVRDSGPNGTLLLRSCGLRVPNPVFSYTNKLYIHVYYYKQSNSYIQSYDVAYTSTDTGRGCGGELYNNRGWLSSPLYPNEFRNNTVCRWRIRVPIGLYAALKFVHFDIQGSCDQTYITVMTYSDDVVTSHKFCKDDRPAILKSHSEISIEYSSSVHNGGTGWLAVFQGLEDDTMDVL